MKKAEALAAIALSAITLCSAMVSTAQERDSVVVHVNVGHADASDSNDGGVDEPVRTIGSAVARAVSFKKADRPTTIIIHPGVYREGSIRFGYTNWSTNDPDNETPIVVRAAEPGTVFIRGSEVFDNWSRTDEANVFAHEWKQDWGPAPNPWKKDRKVAEITLRREMVFVDGSRLVQVVKRGDLDEGHFFVDEAGDKILINLGPDSNPETTLIEVALHSRLWDQNYENNVTIVGLIFEHAATPWDPADAAVWISGSKNVVVDQCEVRNTNWQGLYVGESSGVRVTSTRMNNNGGQGWGMFRVRNLVAIDNETSFNNWRGELSDFTGWSVGNKLLSVHEALIRRHTAVGNFSRGLWLDYDISEAVLDSLDLRENTRDGLWIEASQGPITVKNSLIANNLESGLRSTYSRWIVVDSNRIAGNAQGQIQLDGTGTRTVRDFETGETMELSIRDWVISHNTLEGKTSIDTGQVFKTRDWRLFLAHLVADENRYVSKNGSPGFHIVKAKWSFSEWMEKTGQDRRSTAGS